MEITPHPRAGEFRDVLGSNDKLLTPWQGMLFRFQTVRFPTPQEILSGEGARRTGARWNPRGIRALYGSNTDSVALAECKAVEQYYGVPSLAPRLLVALRVDVHRMLDLTSRTVRQALRLHMADWVGDWHHAIDHNYECLSQALGRIAFEAKASGLIVRSAATPRGINGVIFPQNLDYFERVQVDDGHELVKMGKIMGQ